MRIHQTAIVATDAELAPDVKIGPYAIVGSGVQIAEGCQVGPHAIIEGPTIIGKDNTIHGHAVIGTPPQDQKYRQEKAVLNIGDRNIFREFCTVHRGVNGTQIGSDNLFMAYSHIAHDCRVGNGCILSNGATLGGHVQVEDNAILGGLSAVHQNTRIGAGSMIGGGSMVVKSVPPYTIAQGDRAVLHGINRIGLRRKNISSSIIDDLHTLYKLIFLKGHSLKIGLEKAADLAGDSPEEQNFISFFSRRERGVCKAKK